MLMERRKDLAPHAEPMADTTVDQVTRAERKFYDLVAKMLVTWRTDLGLSRERMAVLLGVDDAIVRRAECATSRVTLWFIRIMLTASGETWEQFGERMQRVDPIIALAAPVDVTLLDAQRRTYEALRLNPATGKPKRAARRRHVEQVIPAQPDHLVGPLYRKAIDCLHEVCVRRLRGAPEWRIGARVPHAYRSSEAP
jgi:hypothetical protein